MQKWACQESYQLTQHLVRKQVFFFFFFLENMPTLHPLSDFTVFEQLHIRCWMGSFSSLAVNTRHWSLLRGNPTSSSKLPGLPVSLKCLEGGGEWGGNSRLPAGITSFPGCDQLILAGHHQKLHWSPASSRQALEPLLVPYEATQAGASVGISSNCELQTRKESVCAEFFKKQCLMQDNTDFPEKKCLCFFCFKAHYI